MPALEVGRRHGAAQGKALQAARAHALQRVGHVQCLHAFGGDLHAETVREVASARELGIAVVFVGLGTREGGIVYDLDPATGRYRVEFDKMKAAMNALSERLLTIQGERHHEKEETQTTYHRRERGFGKYTRSFQLPKDVDAGKIDARFEAGVLKIHLPKKPARSEAAQEIKVS